MFALLGFKQTGKVLQPSCAHLLFYMAGHLSQTVQPFWYVNLGYFLMTK